MTPRVPTSDCAEATTACGSLPTYHTELHAKRHNRHEKQRTQLDFLETLRTSKMPSQAAVLPPLWSSSRAGSLSILLQNLWTNECRTAPKLLSKKSGASSNSKERLQVSKPMNAPTNPPIGEADPPSRCLLGWPALRGRRRSHRSSIRGFDTESVPA